MVTQTKIQFCPYCGSTTITDDFEPDCYNCWCCSAIFSTTLEDVGIGSLAEFEERLQTINVNRG